MAVRICLASSPPLCSFIGNHDDRRPAAPVATPLRRLAAPRRRRERKSVAFADSWGLALAIVHVFPEDELTELQLNKMEDAGLQPGHRDSAGPGSSLVLDFSPPAEDYLDLRNRLKTQRVCLESCWVQDRLLCGTVQVQNLCFEKWVWVRVTFDSWRSFQDLECRYQNSVYGGPSTDTFSFCVLVPAVLDASDRVEFCIRYQTRDQTFWDNNRGDNYQLVDPSRVPETGAGPEVRRDEVDFDPFGSPRTSSGVFPEWQSRARLEPGAPYW